MVNFTDVQIIQDVDLLCLIKVTHNTVFKADKNFVTKVAFRAFTAPQLSHQFCLWQNRFCGLKQCYAHTPLAWKLKKVV